MATLSIHLQQRAFSTPNSSPKPYHSASTLHLPTRIRCSNATDSSKSEENSSNFKEIRNVACGVLAVWAVTAVSPVIAVRSEDIQASSCKSELMCEDAQCMGVQHGAREKCADQSNVAESMSKEPIIHHTRATTIKQPSMTTVVKDHLCTWKEVLLGGIKKRHDLQRLL